MIIDCHVHLNNYHEQVAMSLNEATDNLLKAMEEARIGYALVLTSYIVSPHRPSAAQVITALDKIDNLGVVAGISFKHYRERDLRELADFLKDGLVKGLKLYPGYEPFYPHDSRLRVVYDLAEEFQVPVMIHSGDTYTPKGKVKYAHPLHVDEVAVDHPGVNFVICHIGNPWIRDCMEVVYKNANVYTDISGLVLGNFSDRFERYMRSQLQDMLLFGVEPANVLFGTDWPISSMESYLQFMDELKLPEREKRKIMFDNAARLFRLSADDSLLEKGSLWRGRG
jgi:predicted TIM-barrel fold metal-dependent hydrolase